MFPPPFCPILNSPRSVSRVLSYQAFSPELNIGSDVRRLGKKKAPSSDAHGSFHPYAGCPRSASKSGWQLWAFRYNCKDVNVIRGAHLQRSAFPRPPSPDATKDRHFRLLTGSWFSVRYIQSGEVSRERNPESEPQR